MPVLAGVDGALQLSLLPHVGDDEDLGMLGEVELADHVRLERAEVPAECDMLLRRQVCVPEQQDPVLAERLIEQAHGFGFQPPGQVDAGHFGAAGAREGTKNRFHDGGGRMRCLVAIVALAACSFAHAQFPAKLVRMVIAFSA